VLQTNVTFTSQPLGLATKNIRWMHRAMEICFYKLQSRILKLRGIWFPKKKLRSQTSLTHSYNFSPRVLKNELTTNFLAHQHCTTNSWIFMDCTWVYMSYMKVGVWKVQKTLTTKITTACDVTPCSLVHNVSEKPTAPSSLFSPEDWNVMFHRYICAYLLNYYFNIIYLFVPEIHVAIQPLDTEQFFYRI
jgi:hypothetical protein